MSLRDIRNALREALPDARVITDLEGILRACDHRVELDTGMVKVPQDVLFKVVARRFGEYAHGCGFAPFVAAVAVGKVSFDAGYPAAEYRFATLYYNDDIELITSDFSHILG